MSTPSESFSVRPATEDDLAQLAEMEKRVHVAPWTEEHFRAELGKPYSQTLLLTDDETDTRIAGYIVFWLTPDHAEILNVAVDLPFRGLGHAKALIRKVGTLASQKGLKKVLLSVRKSNLAAIQLYQKLNFTIHAIRKGFYSNGEDSYEMVLSLEGEAFGEF
jgi:ribosomal-protein-alanine N-acetyltransferase